VNALHVGVRTAAVVMYLSTAMPAWCQSPSDAYNDPINWLKSNLGGAACVVYEAGPSPFQLKPITENTEVQFDGCRMVLQQANVTGAQSELRTFRIPLGALATNAVSASPGFVLPEGWATRGDVPTHTITIKTAGKQAVIDERVDLFDGTEPRDYRTDVMTILVRHEENASLIVRALTRAIELCQR
jgi:hypothetical protein